MFIYHYTMSTIHVLWSVLCNIWILVTADAGCAAFPDICHIRILFTCFLFYVYNSSSSYSSSSSSSSLSHFYMGSMWDDSHLHAARSYTSSPGSPFSLRSFSQSALLFFCLPLLLLLCTSIRITLFPTHSSSLLFTCPRTIASCVLGLFMFIIIYELLYNYICVDVTNVRIFLFLPCGGVRARSGSAGG